MKKFLFLIPLIALTACDSNRVPECWNDDSIAFIHKLAPEDGVWQIKNVSTIIEIQGLSEQGKYRYCRAAGYKTNGGSFVVNYKVYRAKNQSGYSTYTEIF